MVRLKDIAQAAGVSVMTVSRVMRDSRAIAPATKARVRALAAQMGYVPDIMAQGLRTRTSKLLGLVVPHLSDPIFARVTATLGEQVGELGYDLIVAHSLNLTEREESCVYRLLARRVDGLFIAPVYRPTAQVPVYDELRRRNTRVVLLGPRAPFCAGFAAVETNEAEAAGSGTRHLLELGHRRIAFFAGPAVSPVAQARLEGYRRALRDAGIEPDDGLVFGAGASVEDGAKATVQMIAEGVGATAVQAVNDLVAFGVVQTLLHQGVRIPGSMSVVGFGNVFTSEHFRVPLTTLRQPKRRLGTAALELMSGLLRGAPPQVRRLSAVLAVRASTGPPPP